MTTFRSTFLLTAATFLSFAATAQRDLDFGITTMKFTAIKSQKEIKWEFDRDTVEAPALRSIEKKGKTIRFTDLLNPTNQMMVDVVFVGFKEDSPATVVYQSASGPDMVMEVSPLVPRVVVKSATRTETFE